MWTDHLWGFHCFFNIIHVKAPCTLWHSLSPERDVSIQAQCQRRREKKQLKTSQTQDAGALAGLSSDKPRKKKKKKTSFNCMVSIKASKMGRLGEPWHITQTLLIRSTFYSEEDQSFSRWKGSVPTFHSPFTISPLFFFSKLRKRPFRQKHVKKTILEMLKLNPCL